MSSGTKDIQIVVNGHLQTAPQGQNLIGLLTLLGVDPARVAVELNRSIIRREDWGQTEVGEGATLEIVQFVGGG
jgi:sulfur carrier protein